MTKKPRSTEGFSTLDDFLSEEDKGLRMDKRHDHLNKLLDPK
jgi:hypothetical protein